MEWSLNKYKTRQENQTWCQRSDEEETIIALQAQVQTLLEKGKTNKATPKKKAKGKSKTDYRAPWMKVPPNEGEPNTKEVEGKPWHWCPTHEAWVRHKPDECRGVRFRGNNSSNTPPTANNNGPAMRLSNALSAVEEDKDDDDDDE